MPVSPRHSRLRIRRTNLAVALVLAFGLLFRDEAHASSAATTSLQQDASQNSATPAPAAPAQQNQASYDASRAVHAAMNQIIKVGFQAAGWNVTTLSSQRDDSSAQGDANRLLDSGQWHIEATDEKGQSLSLDGALFFTMQTESRTGQGFTVIEQSDLSSLLSASSTVTGTLKGTGVEASLDLATDMENSVAGSVQTTNLTMHVLRNGRTSVTRSTGRTESRLIANNVGSQVITGSLERDGRRTDATQTVTVRGLGHGESEIWLESSSTEATGRKRPSVQQHLFQRTVAEQTTQYLDRFDMALGGNRYTLQEPGTVLITPGETPAYSLVLLGKDGAPHKLVNPARPSGLGNVSTMSLNSSHNAGKDLAPAGDAGAAYSLYTVAERLGQGRPGSSAGGPTPEQRAAQRHGAALAVLAAVAIGTVAAADILAGQAAAEAAAALGGREAVTVAGETAAEAAAVAEGTASGAGIISGGYSSRNLARNADPFFVYPDVRPVADAVIPSPLQITRVTGGLVAGVPVVPTSTLAISSTQAVTTSASLQLGDDTPLYDDSPVPFVGGSLPAGATAVGAWAWDTTIPYGAMPSHTGSPSAGPQMHYFLHAVNPLKATPDTNIVQYIYLDPERPPAEIYLQFYTGAGDGEHRAYWGEDLVQTGGVRGGPSLYPMGSMPHAAGWVRLLVPADKLGLSAIPISGVLYGSYGGKVWWGPTTTSNRLRDNAPSSMPVQRPIQMLTTTHGSQIAFRLAAPTRLDATIVDTQGTQVRSLLKAADTAAGYSVLTWDARDSRGAPVPDAPYRVRFSVQGKQVAEHPVTITPFVANIVTPGPFSVVRGNQVPVIGEAYGEGFSHYLLEYGEGLTPTEWKSIARSDSPSLLPAERPIRLFNPGNLANWNVGIDEYRPWKDPGLNGLYTLRLRVIGTDGREASDSLPVIVGRLADTPSGGTITSPDGKAKLTIPALATRRTFAVMSLMPLSQLEPALSIQAWREGLPADATLLGEAYEVMPADELFRRPATLELPFAATEQNSSPDQVGVMIGDGTQTGWHYIGGKADPQRGVVTVQLTGFGGSRALVAAFTSHSFGPSPADPSAGAHLPAGTYAAPVAVSSTSPVAFYNDAESHLGQWEALDLAGTGMERVTGEAAGLSTGSSALKVTRLAGGERLLRVSLKPFDAARYPVVSFDYRLPSDYAPDLLVRSNGVWWQIKMGTSLPTSTGYVEPINAPKLVPDDAWHHYQLDLLALLKSAQPAASGFQVDEMVLGQVRRVAYMQLSIVDSGDVGSAYYVDNFAALRPTNSPSLYFSWSAPVGVTDVAYSYTLDRQRGTVPPEKPGTTLTAATLPSPSGAEDGQWYFHLRGQGADGQWGPATHMPLLIDRQPPQVGTPDPPSGGVGSPDWVRVPLSDNSGLDLDTLRVKVGDAGYSWAAAQAKGGLRYSPDQGSVDIYPALLVAEGSPAATWHPPANGEKVGVAVEGISDYAGNKLSKPYAWSFTADRPEVSGETLFRPLTAKGGSSPSVSPDGSRVAFVSARSGTSRVWVMDSSDREEKSSSAKLLTSQAPGSAAGSASGQTPGGAAAREADPAWSPDGKMLSFASDASGTGSVQIWTSAADGSGARELTTGDGGASSPTWLPDGQAIAFVRDGNLWQVRTDGTGLRALTAYPEKPMRSVRSQPGGTMLAVGFKLYQETVELYDPATGQLQPLTQGGKETDPAWLNS
ncbi:MAG: hypothetical protein M3014_12265, partial [Chloroflexota bacterium]|nr:hypothetical protein [Chloroflexota bacterium]